MPDPATTLLITPISPQQAGNGLAHRCRFWQRVLAELGPVRTLVVPVSGAPQPGDLAVELPTVTGEDPRLPSRARWAPEHLGRAWRANDDGRIDVVLALRADVAGFALGAAARDEAFVTVDLDDDDAALAASLGQREEAARSEDWHAVLGSRADLLVSTTGFGSSTAIPNSVAVGADPGPRSDAAPSTVVMVGNFTYEPNAKGAAWFVQDVLPSLTAAVPEAQLVLAGVGSERFEPYGVGFVPDLDRLHAGAGVAIVPLLHGSGSRIKALDAFAARVPVVGTTVGMSGLPVNPGVHCLVADDPAGFADAVARLLRDRVLGAELADNARSLVERFDVDLVASDAVAVLRAALERRALTAFAPAPDLLVSEEPDGLVVVDETSMTAHHLNELATAVFLLVEGPQDQEAITTAFAETAERPVDEVRGPVEAALSALVAGGLLLAHHGGQPR